MSRDRDCAWRRCWRRQLVGASNQRGSTPLKHFTYRLKHQQLQIRTMKEEDGSPSPQMQRALSHSGANARCVRWLRFDEAARNCSIRQNRKLFFSGFQQKLRECVLSVSQFLLSSHFCWSRHLSNRLPKIWPWCSSANDKRFWRGRSTRSSMALWRPWTPIRGCPSTDGINSFTTTRSGMNTVPGMSSTRCARGYWNRKPPSYSTWARSILSNTNPPRPNICSRSPILSDYRSLLWPKTILESCRCVVNSYIQFVHVFNSLAKCSEWIIASSYFCIHYFSNDVNNWVY